MASTISKVYVKSFERNLRHLAQQSDSRLRVWCEERNEPGSSRNFPRIAAQTMVAKVGTAVATPVSNSVFSNRVAVVAPYHQGDTVEPEDIPQALVDLNSNIAQALGAAGRRQFDDILIAAATGNALDEAGNANAFPAGQTAGDYTTEIDFSAITQTAQLMMAKDIPPEMPKCFVVGSQQARKLLHLAQATQSFYMGAMLTLASTHFVKEFLGFSFILSNRLLAPAAYQRTCLAFTRRAMGLLVEKDLWSRVEEDPSISFAWRVYCALTAGAVRIEDEHIVQLQFADTCTVQG